MSDEAKINIASGFSGGVSVSLRANNAAEVEQLLADAANSPTLTRLLQQAGLFVPDQQGIANVQQAFPQAQPVAQPQSTVGQPVAYQPQVVQQPVVVQQQQPVAQSSNQQRITGPAGAPPGITYPGDCAHGPRVWNDKPARGKAWTRWECNVPWSRNATGRCDSINA